MKLIVGLGNPGRVYANSRHNIGFNVVEALSRAYKVSLKKESSISSLSGKAKIDNHSVIFALPLTFMNLSGSAVNSLVKRYKIDLSDLLIICDDLDLEFGRFKIKPKGSSAGQRGLESAIGALGTHDFCRLRIGIGRPVNKDTDVCEYVLGPFSKKEKTQLKEVIERAISCCRVWITKGIIESMNTFN